jgi:hypothetical protein
MKPARFLCTFAATLIATTAYLLTLLGPEIHLDTYGFHHRDGNGLHFEMS